MSFEADVIALFATLPGVDNRVWWDTMPDGTPIPATGAMIILQQVGGKDAWYLERGPGVPMPSHKNARVMVTMETHDQLLRNSLKRLIEKAVYQSAFVTQIYGAPRDIYTEQLKLFGSQQQFGIWYPDP
jgi:hypothetical protein